MSNPKVLLLDEPSLGLAPLIVNDIMSIIKQINNEGISVLLVEQNARKGIVHRPPRLCAGAGADCEDRNRRRAGSG